MSRTIHRFVTAAVTLAAAAPLAVGTFSPASAAARDGVCDSGEFCYYYNSNNAGAISDFTTSVGNYGTDQPDCYDFKGTLAGHGQCIKNNAASVWNRSSQSVVVYFNSGYYGSQQTIPAGFKGNLNSTLYNNNASHQFVSTSRVNLSYGLYKTTGGRITCGFDGYVNTPGRHEGIDIARSSGSSVYALVSGTVTRVDPSTSLSTIAIYNASLNKTIVYLHSAPISGLSAGDVISKGQKIATEDDRGAGGSPHTHVEMRLGKQLYAAKSVDDYTLDNPDPTSFWNSQGYNES
jgi:murein DD-endopeptidase MepM/ murein hydrolase activator NlpD